MVTNASISDSPLSHLFILYILLAFCSCPQEREARVDLMRKRAREREGLTEEEEEEEVKKRGKEQTTDRPKHINFFADLEQGVSEYSDTDWFLDSIDN